METVEELKANQTTKLVQHRFFPPGTDSKRRPYADYRWKAFGTRGARDKVLGKLRALATEEVPAKAFQSVAAFRRYLKGKHA